VKILFISDFLLEHSPGGAQRSNSLIIDVGELRGHEIHQMHYQSNVSTLKLIQLLNDKKYDYVISSNLEQLAREEGLIDLLHMLPNHVRLEHDMCMYLTEENRYKLFSNCAKTFFLTEYHHKQFCNFYGDYFNNVEIVADPIDTSVFYDYGDEREDVILYVGFMHTFKGTNNFINFAKQNQDKKFIVSAWGSDWFINQILELKNVDFIGKTEYEDMPKLYNKVNSIFYQPVMHEPFCRSVGEAILCGVPELITNDIIGCIHERDRLGIKDFKNSCNNAAKTFWDKLECL